MTGISITACSDLHGFYPELEFGDLLIIAGDCTTNDKIDSWNNFFEWLEKQQYKKKILIAGNHDNFCKNLAISDTFTDDEYDQMYPGEKPILEYLCDSGTEFEGLRIWGSPWIQTFPGMNPHCMAFTCDTDEELAEKWAMIPDDIHILITHSPPYRIFDGISLNRQMEKCTGSISLRNHVMGRIKPEIHCFGHIHEHGGKVLDTVTTKFINCSYVNEHYQPVNKLVRIVL